MISWLETKLRAYENDLHYYDKGSEDYGFHRGAMEAFEDVLEKLKKGKVNES